MGNPSEENIIGILDAIEGHGMEYFVVDCGWFKDGKDWSSSMGDYIQSKPCSRTDLRMFQN